MRHFKTLGFPLLRKAIDIYKTWRLTRYYSMGVDAAKNEEPWIIYMADGRLHHGGLADRICGMVSAFNYCLKHDFVFKINFVCPYQLSKILEPGHYDWRIEQDTISYNSMDAAPIYLSVFSNKYSLVEGYFNKRLSCLHKKQIHFYSNSRFFHEEEFSRLFSEMFKPAPMLQTLIDENIKKLPEHYVSLTFRFQQLLGDFKEDGFPTLKNEDEKELLIEKCLRCIESLHHQEQSTILVTSDSMSFLERVKVFDYVYTISGSIRHMDFSTEESVDISVDMKSFVDFYLLAHADKLYLSTIKPLYRSGFPRVAALVYNKQFMEIS